MIAKRHSSIVALILTVVLCAHLVNVQIVLADGETPTEPPAPTEVGTESPVESLATEPPTAATQLPTEPPVEETPVPLESSLAPEDVAETPIAEVLSQVPENIDVVVLDEAGNEFPLASQGAAETVAMTDPMWCPAGVLPGGIGCSISFPSITSLLTDMRTNSSFYDEAGVIYFTTSTTGSLTLSNQVGSLGAAFDTLKNFDLTLRGGWNGSTDSPSFNEQTNFGTNYIRIGAVANPWVGNLTLYNFEFSSANATVVSIYTTAGDITLDNVDITEHLGNVVASLNSTSGDITVQNSTFSGNATAQSRGFSATTGASISISDTSFTEAGTNAGSGRVYDGATLSAPVVTLTNVIATGNNGDGIAINNANLVTLSNVIASENGTEFGAAGLPGNDGSGVFVNGNVGSRLIIIGGTFVNNQEYGVEVGNPANITIYIQSAPTCTGNDSNAAVSNCYNDMTISDNTAPVITPVVTGAVEVNGWYGGDVSVSWSYTDAESGILSSSGCAVTNLTAETTGTTITCSATNKAGLSNSRSVTIKIDKTGPVLGVSDDIVAEATGPAGAFVSYSVSAVDAVDGPVSTNCSPASGSTFPLGPTTVNCFASDLRGNAGNASFLVTVNDSTAPRIEPFANINASTHRRAGMHLSYSSPATSDLVDGPGVATCSPVSGSFFPVGNTRVSCIATDTHGNSAISVFVITIEYENGLATPEASNSPTLIIPVTRGDLIDLDTNSAFWAFGIKFTFINLADQQAAIHEVTTKNLPAELPEGYSLVLGANVDVLTDGKLLQELPTGASLKMDFPIAGNAREFAILYWNGNEWMTLAEQNGGGQLPRIFSVTVDKPGIFVLVKK